MAWLALAAAAFGDASSAFAIEIDPAFAIEIDKAPAPAKSPRRLIGALLLIVVFMAASSVV
jgi:hypothetical protein